ncbi:MAG: hypothetical protein JSU70_11075 [Phycisphaerales bacterium]|nr:MAG: hypothetical protein JSU70_11075 [Phycisphaerales bacterium]
MTRLSILLLVVTMSLSSLPIDEQERGIAKESRSASFQPKPLDDEWSKWLVGGWKVVSGESSVTDELGKVAKIDVDEEDTGGIEIEFGLNGQFLIMRASSGEMTNEQKKQIKDAFKETTNASDEDIERFLSMPYKSLTIQTTDPKTGEVIGYLFDSQRCIAEGRGRREGHKEIIEWKWSATAQGASSVSIIEKINDKNFTYDHKYTLPNGNTMEDNAEFARKKTKTEK